MTDKKLDERRARARVPLDTPYFVKLAIIGGDVYKVMLSNLSAKGLQVDLPAGVGPAQIPGNSKVEISDFPPELEQLNHVAGSIIWVTEGFCGVQFDRELEDDNFLAFLENL